MTPEELAAIRQRADAATSGPICVRQRGTLHDYDIDAPAGSTPFQGYTRGMFWRREDAEFYAHARADVPALLAEIERLHAVERKSLEQSEYIQKHGLTEWEMSLKDAEIERLRAARAAVEFSDEGYCLWCFNRGVEPHAPDCQRQVALGLSERSAESHKAEQP